VIEAPVHVLIYALAAAALSAVAVHALIVRAHLIRRIVALNILGSAVFLLLIAIARRVPDGPPGWQSRSTCRTSRAARATPQERRSVRA
jgi:multisubunit Na+/H+ antiporter MnhC subunit